jgi:hypothetical protein
MRGRIASLYLCVFWRKLTLSEWPELTVQNEHQRMVFAEWAQNNEVSFNKVWFSG